MRNYFKNHRARLTIILFFVVFVGGYSFFFSSKLLYAAPITPKEEVTVPGRIVEYQPGRSYALISSEYSEKERRMELLLEISNSASDGVNEYYLSADLIGGNVRGLDIKEIYSTPIITVIRIGNLKPFEEMYFLFAPKTKKIEEVSEAETAVLTLNKYNIKYVDTIKDKTENEYQIDRLSSVILKYESQKTALEKRAESLAENKANLLAENAALASELSLLLPEERLRAEQKITSNNEAIAGFEEEIAERNESANRISAEIAEAEKRMGELQDRPKTGQ
jgi:hypothetical protein